jgi:hypothetical protein
MLCGLEALLVEGVFKAFKNNPQEGGSFALVGANTTNCHRHSCTTTNKSMFNICTYHYLPFNACTYH